MRSTVLLAQLALWSSTASAFHPVVPDWKLEQETIAAAKRNVNGRAARGVTLDIKQRRSRMTTESVSARAARAAKHLRSKYYPDETRSASTRKASPASVSRRDNEFDIMEADDPDEDLTAGVSQDGTDYSYFVSAELGSDGAEYWMLIDTGAGSSWVMGSDCDSDACSIHNTFGPDDSSSYDESKDDFSISYGSGTVKGYLATDKIKVAGMNFDFKFGVADETSDDFTHFAFDGILGLSLVEGVSDNFLETVGDSGDVDSNMFCVVLNRASDGDNTGEIRFGSTDEDRYDGDITYTDIEGNDWSIQVDDFGVDGSGLGVGGISAYIDTGTTFMFGPQKAVKTLHEAIDGADVSDDGTTWTVPCDTDTPLTVTFSGTDFDISPEDWISPADSNGDCASNFYGYEVVDGSFLLGDTFLKNVYAVFDKDKGRIGFASLAGSSSESATTSSSQSQSTPSPTSTTSSKSSSSGSSSFSTTGSSSSASKTASSSMPADGLSGHEGATQSSSSSSASKTSSSDSDDDKDDDKDDESAAAGDLLLQARYIFGVCIASMLVMLA